MDFCRRLLLLNCVLVPAVCCAGAWSARLEGANPSSTPNKQRSRTDFYGDPLPVGALARYGALRLCHAAPITCMAYLPDGKTLVSGGRDKALRFWDVASGKEVRTILGCTEQLVTGFALSPDGKQLFGLNERFDVDVWDLEGWKVVRTLAGDYGEVCGLAVSRDGKMLAVGCRDLGVRVWDLATGKYLWTFKGHRHTVHRLAFVPDGSALISAEHYECGEDWKDGAVHVWSIASGTELHRFAVDGSVTGLACSPDGRTLAAAGYSFMTVRVWDLHTGREQRPLPERGALSVAFSRDGATLAVGENESIRLWDFAKGNEVGYLFGGLTDYVTNLAFSPDGKILASLGAGLGNRINLWDWAAGRELFIGRGHRTPVASVAVSPDGKLLATGGAEKATKFCILTGPVRLVQLHPGQRDKTLRIWDAATGEELHVVQPYVENVETGEYDGHGVDVAFSPDGKLLASVCGQNGQPIRFWEPVTGRPVASIPTKTEDVNPPGGITFSPDGTAVAAPGSKGPRFWDVRSGKELDLIEPQVRYVRSVCFAPDGKTLAATAYDSPLRVWDLATGKERMRATKGTASRCALFTTDGKSLAAIGDNSVELWDARRGTLLRTWPQDGERHGWDLLALSPDGKLVVVSAGPVLHLLEAATWQEVRQFEGHRGNINCLKFSADGRRLYSASSDYTVLAWDPLSAEGLCDGTAPGDGPRVPLDQLWEQLGIGQGPGGYRALCLLASRPEEAVQYLGKRFRPAPREEGALISQLIGDLDSQEFATRARAFERLGQLDTKPEKELRRAAKDSPSAEVRRQARILLERLTGPLSGSNLRIGRAVQILERSGSGEARAALSELAKGSPSAEHAGQAKAALERLKCLGR